MNPGVRWYVNTTSDDESLDASPSKWEEMTYPEYRLIFGAGSATVADGESAFPGNPDVWDAGTVTSGSPVAVSKCFLDYQIKPNSETLKEVPLFSTDSRYVFCVEILGETASEPTLEFYDDFAMTTNNLEILGGGTPADSMISGIATTIVAPPASWAGYKLAGSTYTLGLNGGNRVTAATKLYFNLKIIIAAGASEFWNEPYMAVRYAFH